MRRTGLLVILFAGLAAGFVLGRMTTPAGAPPADEAAVREHATERPSDLRDAPSLAGRVTAQSDPATGAVLDRAGDDPESPPIGSDRGALFEILVTDAGGEPVPAQVFVIPRDAGEWDQHAEGYQEGPRPCVLRVPIAGSYDVFARAQGPLRVAGREDVAIAAGETLRVPLQVQEGRPLVFEATAPWLIRDLLRTYRVEASIHVTARHAPGWRQDPTRMGAAVNLFVPLGSPDGPWVSPPLPPGLEYEVEVWLSAPRSSSRAPADLSYGVLPEPPIARAGDTVKLRASRTASLHLTLRAAQPDAWPEGPVSLQLRLEQADGTRDFSHGWRRLRAFLDQEHPRILTGVPGPARVTWDGPGIAPGTLESLVLDPDETLLRTIWLEIDPAELPSRDPLSLTLRGLPPPPYEENDELEFAGLLPSEDEDFPSVLAEFEDVTSETELDYGWRRAEYIVVWLGRRFVSVPVPAARQGTMTAELRPAGMLVVVPEQIHAEGTGLLRLRRADGLPFLVAADGRDGPVLRRSAIVEAGDRIGPLAAGRHVFEAVRMGKRLPDVTVDVAPGRVGILGVQ